ncbi:MAG: DUF11 domain-containing protein [Anaerolineae bacterium]|nr:DUF11 domain-containing protein [Anaerolineae bacterium]
MRKIALGFLITVMLLSFFNHPVHAASSPYQNIIDQLNVEVGIVTLPGADADGFVAPTRWTVTVNDPGKTYIQALRQRYEDLARMRNVDWGDPVVQEKVARLNQDLAWRVAQQDPQTGAIAGGMDTVRSLAFAYHIPGSPYYRDESVIRDHIEPAILYERDHGNLHPENGLPGGWWTWEVKVPFNLIDVLFAVGDQLSAESRGALEDMLIWLNLWSGREASSNYTNSPTGQLFHLTEANGAWFRTIALLTGLYFELPPVVQWSVNEFNETMHVNTIISYVTDAPAAFGPKPDYTPWDHGQAPNQLYGDHLFATLGFVAYLTDGSPRYGLSSDASAYLGEYFHQWLRWNTFHALEMPATRGRWPHLTQNGELFLGAVFMLSTASPRYADELARVVADWLAEHPGDLDMRQGDRGFATPWFGNFHLPFDTLIGQPLLATAETYLSAAASPPTGARYYPYSEFLVVRRPTWYAGMAMRSDQVPFGGLHREHDGGIVVMTEDNYIDYNDLDAAGRYLYGGITAMRGEPYQYWLRDQSPMAGGATLRDYAVGGMDLKLLVSAEETYLWARKSCFAFDKEIVCVGSDIHSDDPREVLTYLHTFPDAGHSVQSGGGWLHDGVMGVALGDGRALTIENVEYDKDGLWHQVFISHGTKPSNAAYSFALLPEANAVETQSYAAHPDYSILHRDASAHVVYDASSRTTGVVFFEATNDAAGHACSGPAQLIYTTANGQVQSLSFYNPAYPAGTTSYTLNVPVPPSTWLVNQAQNSPYVEGIEVRADGFQLSLSLPRFEGVTWLRTPPDLASSIKTVNTPAPKFGEMVTYTITIRNSGSPVTDTVAVSDSIPAGLEYVPQSVIATLGSSSYNDGVIHWSGVLSNTPEVVITYAATVTEKDVRLITNTALIDAGSAGVYSRTATIVANGVTVHLPLVVKGW